MWGFIAHWLSVACRIFGTAGSAKWRKERRGPSLEERGIGRAERVKFGRSGRAAKGSLEEREERRGMGEGRVKFWEGGASGGSQVWKSV